MNYYTTDPKTYRDLAAAHRERLTAAIEDFPEGNTCPVSCDGCGAVATADCLVDDKQRLDSWEWTDLDSGLVTMDDVLGKLGFRGRFPVHRERYLALKAYQREQDVLRLEANAAREAGWADMVKQHTLLVACEEESCRAPEGQPCKGEAHAKRISAGAYRAHMLGCSGSWRLGTDMPMPTHEAIIAAVNRLKEKGVNPGHLPIEVDGRLVTAAYRDKVLAEAGA